MESNNHIFLEKTCTCFLPLKTFLIKLNRHHHGIPSTSNSKQHLETQPFRNSMTSSARKQPVSSTPLNPTPLTEINFRGRTIFVKRDDELNINGVTGSKFRKFHLLFNDPDINKHDGIISYGGAQSNAMYALANFCNHRQIPFIYITRPVPKHVYTTKGNFFDALNLNMQHVELDLETFRTKFSDLPPDSIMDDAISILKDKYQSSSSTAILNPPMLLNNPYFIPQGGAWPGAEYGISVLAEEIRNQIAELRSMGKLVNKKPILFLPCGTGTTAYYLQKHLIDIAQVVAIPVSGSEIYLVKQMRWLSKFKNNKKHNDKSDESSNMDTLVLPDILRPRLRASFADIRPEKLKIWEELSRSTKGQFQFDLIYAPKAWEEFMLALEQGRVAQDGQDILYYHTGGVEGNVSMIERFERKGMFPKSISE